MTFRRGSYLYNRNDLMSFVDALEEASAKVTEFKPDRLVAPMNGANPFIDLLAIIDSNFDADTVEYMPASSSIIDSPGVIREWYGNFLEQNGEVRRVLLLDEVVSGSSVVKLHKNISRAERTINNARQSRDISNLLQTLTIQPDEGVQNINLYFTTHGSEDEVLTLGLYELLPKLRQDPDYFQTTEGREAGRKLIKAIKNIFPTATHHIVGLEDEKIPRKGKERNKTYRQLRDEGVVTGIPVRRIITMDKPHLNPARYQEATGHDGYCHFLPRVAEVVMTPQYLALLQDVARMKGVDPDSVAIANPSRMMEAHKYLSPERFE